MLQNALTMQYQSNRLDQKNKSLIRIKIINNRL